MRLNLAASLIAPLLLGVAAAPLAAQSSSPGGFSLPPNPSPTPTANPRVQGPVDPDQPILTQPRDTTRPTPTPTPASRPTPTPTATAAPARPAATPTPAPRSLPPARPRTTATTPLPTPLPTTGRVPTPAPTLTPLPAPGAAPTFAPAPAPSEAAPAVAAPAAAAPAQESGSHTWLWLGLGALAALAAAVGAMFVLRKREESWDEPAPIEPPLARVKEPAEAAPAPQPAAAGTAPLVIDAQALKLARSVMFATLSYQLRLTNTGRAPITGIRLGGDLVTAHGQVPVDRQLADPALPLEIVHDVASLGPGESVTLKGDLRLPVQQIRPIPQGGAALYVPLLRVRAEAAGIEPLARTFVVGMRPAQAGGKLQPFRLDDMPQTYAAIGQRALD